MITPVRNTRNHRTSRCRFKGEPPYGLHKQRPCRRSFSRVAPEVFAPSVLGLEGIEGVEVLLHEDLGLLRPRLPGVESLETGSLALPIRLGAGCGAAIVGVHRSCPPLPDTQAGTRLTPWAHH